MAWIRRRRKEREEKERQERERALSQTSIETSAGEREGREDKVVEDQDEKENEVVQRALGGSRTPRRQGTVDSTFSMTSSTSTIRPASPKIMSGLSLSRPTSEPEGVGATVDGQESGSDEEEDVVDGVSDEDSEDEEEDLENDGKGAEEAEEEEDDDDLDPEELAQEEALADAARRSAKGAGTLQTCFIRPT
jgi:hypothetical protein